MGSLIIIIILGVIIHLRYDENYIINNITIKNIGNQASDLMARKSNINTLFLRFIYNNLLKQMNQNKWVEFYKIDNCRVARS